MKNITKRKYNEYEGRFIIPVMDPPMENTEAGTKDGIPDGNIDLQEPFNNRTVVNSGELFRITPRE